MNSSNTLSKVSNEIDIEQRSQSNNIVCLWTWRKHDRVPWEEVWYCMRNSGVAEKYVRIVQDMYDDSTCNSNEVCGRSDGGIRGEGGAASRIGVEPLFVCDGDG